MDQNTAQRFDVNELKHITEIDWNNEEHRRCIVAGLVKATYDLESDRARGMPEKLAPPWWESFHFHLREEVKEQLGSEPGVNDTIFGAIFEYVPPNPGEPGGHPSAPRYVVAFRGTMTNHPHWAVAIEDIFLDFKILCNKLKKRTRCELAYDAVRDLMDHTQGSSSSDPGPDRCVDVWLAGHSLGASLALEAGRAMMKMSKLNHPTFLFNPPHVALITGINFLHLPNAAKRYLHYTSYFFKAGAGKFLASSHRKEMETLFDLLSPWVPNMYLHNKDWICQGFIDYFQLRQLFLERFSHVGRRSMMLSYRDMFFALLRKEKERPHLMPSAMLWMSAQSELHPHGLQQWWKPNEEIGLGAGTRYSYPSSTIPET